MSVARGHGVWQRAIELELPANANSTIGDEAADLMSVSCWSIRNCVAVGHYGANSTPSLAMVATDRGGRWGRAVQVKLPPGADTAIGHEIASLWSVACTGTGDCVATGQYNNRDSEPRPMLVTETNGKWARAVTVRAPAGEGAAFVGLGPVACAHRGSCVAIGTDENGDWLLTALQAQGRWTAAPAPPAARGTRWALQSVFCHAAGCVAVGQRGTATGGYPIVVAERRGSWTPPHRLSLPPNAAPGVQNAYLLSVSCPTRNTCAAVGFYYVPFGPRKLGYTYRAAMTMVENSGRWSKIRPLSLASPAHTANR